jgi:hypothetical protein
MPDSERASELRTKARVGSVAADPQYPTVRSCMERSNILYVAEVKSVTTKNEEKQLRLGLGQVLRYKHLLGLSRPSVRAVLVIERGPTDPSWFDLCRSLGVILISPDSFDRLGGS